VLLRRQALHQLLGPVLEDGASRDLDDATVAATLTALGCRLEARPEGWAVRVPPSRRTDLQREVDLIEEVARLVGFDRFASHLPDPLVPGGLDASQEAERRLRRALVLSGLQETTSSSLVAGDHGGRVAIANPLLAEASHLRDSLLEPLLAAACRNLQASQPGFWAFEIGHVFPQPSHGAEPSDPSGRQQARLSGILCGERRSELWSSSGKPTPPGYHAARGVLGRALEAMNLPVSDRPLRDQPMLHPGRAAELVLEGRPVGWFGQLHPRLAGERDLPDASYLFDLDLERLLAAATRANRWRPQFRPFATVPSTERDLAVVVSRDIPAADLLQAIERAGRPLLEQAVLVDRFESDQLGEGRCSQAFRLRYRDAGRTLTDEDVAPVHERIVTSLAQRFRAVLRT
jgi:phenylalanyl-tRNA synthetase beta chain